MYHGSGTQCVGNRCSLQLVSTGELNAKRSTHNRRRCRLRGLFNFRNAGTARRAESGPGSVGTCDASPRWLRFPPPLQPALPPLRLGRPRILIGIQKALRHARVLLDLMPTTVGSRSVTRTGVFFCPAGALSYLAAEMASGLVIAARHWRKNGNLDY
jgi:hypothetical protein